MIIATSGLLYSDFYISIQSFDDGEDTNSAAQPSSIIIYYSCISYQVTLLQILYTTAILYLCEDFSCDTIGDRQSLIR